MERVTATYLIETPLPVVQAVPGRTAELKARFAARVERITELEIVAELHNGSGYFFGYWLARLACLDLASCRTVAIEGGLQNDGIGKLATVGLAAAVFSPWMNISESILANHWRRRPVGAPTPKP